MEVVTGVVLLKLPNSARLALEVAVGGKTHMDPGGCSKRQICCRKLCHSKIWPIGKGRAPTRFTTRKLPLDLGIRIEIELGGLYRKYT